MTPEPPLKRTSKDAALRRPLQPMETLLERPQGAGFNQ